IPAGRIRPTGAFLTCRPDPVVFRSVLPWCVLLIAAAPPPAPFTAAAEDGYDLWLRYRLVADAERLKEYRAELSQLVVEGDSPTLRAARDELILGLRGLLGTGIRLADEVESDGAIVAGTPATSRLVAALPLADELRRAGDEGFVLRALPVHGRRAIVIAANREVGVLYGAFDLLRLVQTYRPLQALAVVSAPRIRLRLLDHWDNLDGSVVRGYAGRSLWDWSGLPDSLDPRYRDYARANADPLDPAVRAWWRHKVDEIYRVVPDFGGFLVKANSEGQPGPQDYGRTHADGATMLADALASHGGVVMWRAFVYSTEVPTGRVRQAYDEFTPQDGAFRENVLLQVKNGPLDFQPREPFHPLFGAMPRTPLMLEFQITKEYLGEDTHLVFLGPLFKEVLDADTYARGEGSTVARVVDGSLHGYTRTGIAGVANIGTDRNWTGSHFNQANWYAFGRLAWDHTLSSGEIAEEWIRMTFVNEPAVVPRIKDTMLGSPPAAVHYMTPLGLAHIMAAGHHYGPGPWVARGRPDQTPVYFHRADTHGIGFERTAAGTGALAQYFPPLGRRWGDRDSVPDALLLWFHRVGWNERLRSGRTLWEELVHEYSEGVDSVRSMARQWSPLEGAIDAARFRDVAAFLAIQQREARWWRDAAIAYFQTFSRQPVPPGYAPPAHSLEFYVQLRCPADPHKPRCDAIQDTP